MITLNIYRTLNEITLYIENNLTSKIDYNHIAKMMGVNQCTMQRVFSVIANITLTEYIRKRRLSNAGYDLYNNPNLRIIDIALKYNYENPTSFSRAFTNFHGIKPSKINKNTKLKIFPRLIFEEKENPQCEIPYEIIELNSFTFYGKSIKTDNKNIHNDAPAFFSKNENKYSKNYGEIPYGMITYEDQYRLECNAYWILYKCEIPGFTKVFIPKSKWLVFKIYNQNPQDIQKMSTDFYQQILPSCHFNLSNLPELEYYHDKITEFLIPIK